MKHILICALTIVIGLSAVTLADGAATFQSVIDVSNSLQTFSASIMMTQYSGNVGSTIEFQFTYVPPTKMRIEYTSPKALVGQLLIINGDQLYTYMPALHRSMHKTTSGDGGGEGEEMGFLYYFVSHDVDRFVEDYDISSLGGSQEYTFEHGGSTVSYDAYKVELSGASGREIVWCDGETLVPVAIDIYDKDKLTIEVRVVSYEYNASVPEATFVIPD